jgi:integrase/recombinase XerD
VPLPDSTLTLLNRHQKEYGDSLYVFPNGQGGQEGHFLRILQNIAHRAELNCGHCKNVGEAGKQNCKDHAVCGEWGLHRFRKTCATTWLHAGINIRKIQSGWAITRSTSRWLTLRTRMIPRTLCAKSERRIPCLRLDALR